jgi:hypothetical protein
MVAKLLETVKTPLARKGLEAALALYDAELVGAPVKPERVPADRKVAALRARRTMLVNELPGTRGKKRAELKAKIAAYDAKIAA